MVSQEMAFSSYSRRPQTSHIQAGKFGTVTSSSFSHVKYVMKRRCMRPDAHSEHGKGCGEVETVSSVMESFGCAYYTHELPSRGFQFPNDAAHKLSVVFCVGTSGLQNTEPPLTDRICFRGFCLKDLEIFCFNLRLQFRHLRERRIFRARMLIS